MSFLRLAILSRSFWPLVGNVEQKVGSLAVELRRQNHQVKLLTSQWDAGWSTQFEYREIPVTRVVRSFAGPWASSRYTKAMTRELITGCANWDAVFVNGGIEELEAALRARERSGPQQIVFRLDARLRRQMNHSNALRKKIISAINEDVILHLAEESLRSYFSEWIRSIDQSVTVSDGIDTDSLERLNPESRAALRNSIGDLHPLLQVTKQTLVGISSSEFDGDESLFQIIEAWSRLQHRYQDARLWLIGDGPQTAPVWQQINDLEIAHCAVLIGSFDHARDGYQAADFYIHADPNYEDTNGVVDAMACGLPVVFCRSSHAPSFLVDGQTGLGFETGSINDLSRRLLELIVNKPLQAELGKRARNAVSTGREMSRIASGWVELLSKLKSKQTSSACDS